MNDRVYLLWFVPEHQEDGDTELLIGVYDSEAAAKAAIGRVKGQPGFVDFPEGFQIHARVIGQDSWTKGLVRVE
jgi:hypothetical protein